MAFRLKAMQLQLNAINRLVGHRFIWREIAQVHSINVLRQTDLLAIFERQIVIHFQVKFHVELLLGHPQARIGNTVGTLFLRVVGEHWE